MNYANFLHFYERMFSENHIFMNECLAENYTFMNVLGALAGLGIPIKEALRGFCNKIVTRLKHVSFPQKVDRLILFFLRKLTGS